MGARQGGNHHKYEKQKKTKTAYDTITYIISKKIDDVSPREKKFEWVQLLCGVFKVFL